MHSCIYHSIAVEDLHMCSILDIVNIHNNNPCQHMFFSSFPAKSTTPYTNVLTPTTTSTSGVSLVVSVPLSTAGVNLPPNNTLAMNSSTHHIQAVKPFAPSHTESMPVRVAYFENIFRSLIVI